MGLREGDIRRIVWTFAQAAVSYAALAWAGAIPEADLGWRMVLVGALAAGISAAKNLVLGEGSTLK